MAKFVGASKSDVWKHMVSHGYNIRGIMNGVIECANENNKRWLIEFSGDKVIRVRKRIL